jgi:hypothetical protein
MNKGCNCQPGKSVSLSRREFVKLTGLTGAALAFKNTSLIAGPLKTKTTISKSFRMINACTRPGSSRL